MILIRVACISLFVSASAALRLFETVRFDSVWDLFPCESMWPNILMAFKDEAQIAPYLDNYFLPFRQLQKAVRDDSISPDVIRSNLMSLIDAYSDAMSKYIVSPEVFSEAKSSDVGVAARHAAVFIDNNPVLPYAIGPVFTTASASTWLKQRLEDMVVGSTDYNDFVRDRDRLNTVLQTWQGHLRQMSGASLKHVVRVTEDLDEVQRKLLLYMTNYHKNVTSMDNDQKTGLFWQILMLGNSASRTQDGLGNLLALVPVVLCILL